MNLDAYFARIGYTGPHRATLETLSAIHAAHAEAIPFENLDVLLGRPISLDPAAVFQKLVTERRGGYCFEQNILLGGVLRELGFQVTPLIARVRWQVPTEVATPQTHMVLRVDLDGVAWLADAGFGGVGLTAPIQIVPDIDQGTPPEGRRLLRDDRIYRQQVRFDSEWLDVYRFALDPVPPIDFEVANWFTSAHPKSRFRQLLMVARVDGDRRLTIQNREFIVRQVGRPAEKNAIGSADELLALLAERFGLYFPAGTRFGPPGSPWPS
ncbi:arylamine N-acetyltransferase family protein [Opitutus terrae]|uniref:Arylamine N-acetyltransferase n=1 Tax=Opitutus terrae (strain DSM 11246 / JCM 15787 / PB90-1) TaxID=452637 RepID=B1ZTN6_OPITP|nr:arylamine N-acetyltransferase [Opitutus terrae]ACB74822.1 Arylamine N-acetyltransferase [Opitutus terrae PB90-1]